MFFRITLFFSLLILASCNEFEEVETCPNCVEVGREVDLTIDFRNPNSTGGKVGFRYYLDGGDYPADYNSYLNWNCFHGPDYWASWDDVNGAIWFSLCRRIDFDHLKVFNEAGDMFLPVAFDEISGVHEETYSVRIDDDLRNYIESRNGLTVLRLIFDEVE